MIPARKILTAVAAVLAVSLGSGLAQADDDAKMIKKGKKVFNKCKTCHLIDKEKNKIGPHLVGIIGRQAGAVEGFKYSDAMKNSGIVWNEEELLAYVTKPKEYIPGNKMVFAGLKKEKHRQRLMAYIKSLMPAE